jgi:hypothetical protein
VLGNIGGTAMSKEDKQLLLADLCARLPYGVKVIRYIERNNKIEQLIPEIDLNLKLFELYTSNQEFIIKPYLRPMSSMTEEEKDKYSSFVLREHDGYLTDGMPDYTDKHYVYIDNVNIFIDWLNAHHFDYRGLIEKGLAIEASEDMYKH